MNTLQQNPTTKQITRCLLEIEAQLDRGPSAKWKTEDFEQLSAAIFQQTGTSLSVTTLKRLWGKIKYDSAPSLSTLNALANYLGKDDWRAFENAAKTDVPTTVSTNAKAPKEVIRKFRRLVLPVVFIGSLFLLVPAIRQIVNRLPPLDPAEFTFRSRPLAEGLPNSVVFEYDAAAAPANARVEIQQNWDNRRRTTVSAAAKVATSIYHQPGFYQAKLVINDQIVQEHDVFIPSENWLGLIHRPGTPIYVRPTALFQENQLSIPDSIIGSHPPVHPSHEQWVSYQHAADYGAIDVQDFELVTHLKSDAPTGLYPCQKAEIVLLCSGEAIIIPLSIKGCAADLRLWLLDRALEGKSNDLSAFGVDFSDWVKVTVRAQAGRIAFYLNDQLARELPLPAEKDKRIVGIRYRFQGHGSIRDVLLAKNGEAPVLTWSPANQ